MFKKPNRKGQMRKKRKLEAPPEDDDILATYPLMGLAVMGAGMPADGSMVYLSPAPLYHAAPIGWCTTAQRLGGTVVVMEKFDPEHALETIEKYKVTDSQWVPTHFVRMLKLDPEVRTRDDLSSHQRALHAAFLFLRWQKYHHQHLYFQKILYQSS